MRQKNSEQPEASLYVDGGHRWAAMAPGWGDGLRVMSLLLPRPLNCYLNCTYGFMRDLKVGRMWQNAANWGAPTRPTEMGEIVLIEKLQGKPYTAIAPSPSKRVARRRKLRAVANEARLARLESDELRRSIVVR